MSETDPLIVYFSSVGENTKRFVEKLPFESLRIPLRRTDDEIQVDRPFVLVTPTYGAGHNTKAVPKQVAKFLKPLETRRLCLGVIGGGNRNFGEHFLFAAVQLAEAMQVPLVHGFEVSGNATDVDLVTRSVVLLTKDATDCGLHKEKKE